MCRDLGNRAGSIVWTELVAKKLKSCPGRKELSIPLQSNLDYPDFFSGPNLVMNIY